MMQRILIQAFIITYATCIHHNDPTTLDVASFNMQVFGVKKIENPLIKTYFPKIIRLFDLIALQEVRDSSGKAILKLIDLVNENSNFKYKLLLSSRLGRSTSKEEYAVIYREDWLTATSNFTYNDVNDVFEREPHVVRFTSRKASIKDFAVINIHTKPKDAQNEIRHLVDVYDQTKSKFNLDDVMIMGDYNGDCVYVKDWSKIELATDKRFYWLIDESKDTTTAETDCTYDRIVIAGNKLLHSTIPLSPAALYFDELYHLTEGQTKLVSDHYPVYFQIRGADERKFSFGTYSNIRVTERLKRITKKQVCAMKKTVKKKLKEFELTILSQNRRQADIIVRKNVIGSKSVKKYLDKLSKALPDIVLPTEVDYAMRLLEGTSTHRYLPKGYGRYQTLYDFYKADRQKYRVGLSCDVRAPMNIQCPIIIAEYIKKSRKMF